MSSFVYDGGPAEHMTSRQVAAAMVQGSSRGIGLEMVRQLLQPHYSANHVIATCRSPSTSPDLLELQRKFGRDRLTLLALDVTKEKSILDAADLVKKSERKIGLLINSAGLLWKDSDVNSSVSIRPERRITDISEDATLLTFRTNVIGPMLVAKYFTPLLHGSSSRFKDEDLLLADQGGKETKIAASMFVNISARVGSISDNMVGGWYSYRASKASLNQLTRTMAIELGRKGSMAVAIHPGTVSTDLSQPFRSNVKPDKLFSVEVAASQILSVIHGLKNDQNGMFFSWDGSKIPW